MPLLIIQGGQDDIVPPAMGKAVLAAAHEPKQLAVFPEADHTEHYKFGSYDVIFQRGCAMSCEASPTAASERRSRDLIALVRAARHCRGTRASR